MAFSPCRLPRWLVLPPRRRGRSPNGRARRFRLEAICALESRELLASLLVTTVADSGPGSLRQAILSANAAGGASTIDFQIAGAGPFLIQPASALPAITAPVTIDGYSQPGARANSLALGDDAAILLQIDGGFQIPTGLELDGGGSTIRGLSLTGFQMCIQVSGPGGNAIEGNFLGLDPANDPPLQLIRGGVLVDNSPGNLIGGATPAARNVVGNSGYSQGGSEIHITGAAASGNVVMGNYIGTDPTGTVRLPGQGGLWIDDAPATTVGGAAPGAGNVIASSFDVNLQVTGADAVHTVIQGNRIGTDAAGTASLNTFGDGVRIGGSDQTVGGTAPGAGNLISGSQGRGLLITATDVVVQGNIIGLDATGLVPLPNDDGVFLAIESSGVTLGGTAPGAGNLISGNDGTGVQIRSAAGVNQLLGNRIGPDAAGGVGLGVQTIGVYINASSGNAIGGLTTGAGNVIAGNTLYGVLLVQSSPGDTVENAILSNRIYADGQIGIDLGGQGDLTPSSVSPADSAANRSQSHPVLDTALGTAQGDILLGGTLAAAANATYILQFFSSPAGGPGGHGAAQTLLGTTSVTTDALGQVRFTARFAGNFPAQPFVTATATDARGDTSDLADDLQVVAADPPVYAAPDAYNTDVDTPLVVAAPGLLLNDLAGGTGAITAEVAALPAHGTLTLAADGSFRYQPDAGYAGPDSFTYRAVQGGARSAVATVTLSVNPKILYVTSTADDGPGSLRQAILTANTSNTPAPDTIRFAIPGTGPFQILGLSPLPTITRPTVIDGYSQPGSHPNTLAQGDDAVILIQLGGRASIYDATFDALQISGGGTTIRGLALGSIDVSGAGGDAIQGNFFGLGTSSYSPTTNAARVHISGAGGDLIGGSDPSQRNVINGRLQEILVDGGAAGVVIAGNYLGTDTTGLLGYAYGSGIILDDAPDTTIGGTTPGAGNLIASVSGAAITVGGASARVVIQGNLIGTDRTGETALGDVLGYGIVVNSGPGTLIGGTVAAARNVIAAELIGAWITSTATDVTVQGNYIGTDASGTRALPNASIGLAVDGIRVTVGGTAAGAGNLISGNAQTGLEVGYFGYIGSPGDLDPTHNIIQGNRIGTDFSGTTALPNGGAGVVVASGGSTIGGTAAGAGNVISGNVGAGLAFRYGGDGNLIQGNAIGTDATGTVALGNGGAGLQFDGAASGDTVGGTTPGAGNRIANNSVGVAVGTTSIGIAILSNAIAANAGLGIDLGEDGPTPNAPGGPHAGANHLQNHPVVTAAVDFGGGTGTSLVATLDAAPLTTYLIQFFADPSGRGQAPTFLGQVSVTTDADGHARATLAAPSLAGQVVTATATNPDGDTSELADAKRVIVATQSPQAQDDAYRTDRDGVLEVGGGGVLDNDLSAGGVPFTATLVQGPANGVLDLRPDGTFTYTPATGFVGFDSFTYRDVLGAASSNLATVRITVAASVFTVRNTLDSGPGSLRQAILDVNLGTGVGPNTIDFAIPGAGPFTIHPYSDLPVIAYPTTVDGYSQPGSVANTAGPDDGTNAVLMVVLDFSQAFDLNGLVLDGGSSVVRGLVINGYRTGGIALNGPGGDRVEGNFIGSDVAGTSVVGSGVGVVVNGGTGTVIGGTTPGDRNLILSSHGRAILVLAAAGAAPVLDLIEGNLIGTDATGRAPAAGEDGSGAGVVIQGANQVTIGGSTPCAGNVISGILGGGGIVIGLNPTPGGPVAAGTLVQGNLFGADAAAAGLGPYGTGLADFGSDTTIVGNSITGFAVGAYLAGTGVRFLNNGVTGNNEGTRFTGSPGATYSDRPTFLANQITGNRGVGLNLTGSGAMVQGNTITGNGGDGVDIYGSDNQVGGTYPRPDPGTANVITGNGGNGVRVLSPGTVAPMRDEIRGNVITGNGRLGIDLVGGTEDAYGVTTPGTGNPSQGPNALQAAPVLTSYRLTSAGLTVQLTLTAPNVTALYSVDFYTSDRPDPSGHGQAQRYIGTQTIFFQGEGLITCTYTFPGDFAGQYLTATATDSAGDTSEFSRNLYLSQSQRDDYDGDGQHDLAAYDQALGAIVYRSSASGQTVVVPFGTPQDHPILAPGDYDGDGITDFALYDQPFGAFVYLASSTDQVVLVPFGTPQDKPLPAPGDYDGDGITDFALYDQPFGAFVYRASSTNQVVLVPFGTPQDKPLPAPGDYDGDGKTDLALYDQPFGAFVYRASSTNQVVLIPFGTPQDKPLPAPGDYDGDGKTDLALYDQPFGAFVYRASSTNQVILVPFGTPQDKPVPAIGDLDGDGRSDLTLYDQAYGAFVYLASSTNQVVLVPFAPPKPTPMQVVDPLVPHVITQFAPAPAESALSSRAGSLVAQVLPEDPSGLALPGLAAPGRSRKAPGLIA